MLLGPHVAGRFGQMHSCSLAKYGPIKFFDHFEIKIQNKFGAFNMQKVDIDQNSHSQLQPVSPLPFSKKIYKLFWFFSNLNFQIF